MTEKEKSYYNDNLKKAEQLSKEANRLMEIADSFAEKGDKEQFKSYWIQSAKKHHEANVLLNADIEKLLEELAELTEKSSEEK